MLLIVCLLSLMFDVFTAIASNSSNACGECQNRSICNETTSRCMCFGSYYGIHCEIVEMDQGAKYNCIRDGGCEHDGVCLENGVCRCVRPYYGIKCHRVDNWLHDPRKKVNEKSILVSVSLGVIFINAVCFIVICVSMRRNKDSQPDDEEDSSEHFVHTEGPPRLRGSLVGRRQSSGYQYRPSWYLPFHEHSVRRASRSREGASGLHPVSTAPAILQGSQPPKYGDVTLSPNETSGISLVTIQPTRLNSIPPGYDEIMECSMDDDKDLLSSRCRLSTSSGIQMRTILPSTSSAETQRLVSLNEAIPYDIEEEEDEDHDGVAHLRTQRLTSLATSHGSSVFTDGEEPIRETIVEVETRL
ncbi:uncharacterized protein [Ptychodera flava]|uniref:uncharacterized protein isoform X2 n=1 Tax=Ptychodera flava TaxID=63121 RepID=UPI00396A9A55